MRAVEWRDAPVDDEFLHFTETCVQCRGCEPACPSGVPFGHLIEDTLATLASEHAITPRWQRLAYRVLGHHRSLLAGSTVLAVAQRLRLVPKRVGLARLPIRRGRRPDATAPSGTDPDVWLFTGCVMDAWLRSTHRATAALVAVTGHTFRWSSTSAGCCGALHVHAGLTSEAQQLARGVIASLPGDAPILVNSAGCGAALKDYGHLLGTPDGAAFSARVRDIDEWLADRIDDLPPAVVPLGPVVVQDPCHLRHVQRRHESVRTVLAPYAELIELDDDGVCCGAGGAYSAVQPELAGAVRARKLAAIERATVGRGATVVASANPGCAMHLAAAGVHVEHPVDLVARATGLSS